MLALNAYGLKRNKWQTNLSPRANNNAPTLLEADDDFEEPILLQAEEEGESDLGDNGSEGGES
eukprot:CAMPEP_0114588812 /NCGR_PEP_ID=MMETSP0125-20121206/11428_1 /TAXON_ID=485358 ORGANISM="Aristerostoma sp., Strain ATCC 50986" /NCGR_SAMPLE_ID=MMETSP0125 /ASSEMBLY_ACC=CAM_ASM_000245 /LENGTH=62 /DNA_ID=CAMNT_0001785409 /DNA_START=133 /DNA_END=321 /DNA_ORIENTATION=+